MFQTAINNMGQDTQITGRVDLVEPSKFNSNKKLYQDITINDGQRVERARVYLGKGSEIPITIVNTEQSFTLKARDYKGAIYFSGFYNPKQQDASPPPAKDYSKVQTAYDEATKKHEETTNNTDLNIARQCAYKNAPETAKEILFKGLMVYDVLDEITNWIMTGKAPQEETPKPADKDIPF